MSRPYIERLLIEHYGCVRRCDLALSPLHALVGPNDSGKSTVLTALRTMGLWASRLDEPGDRALRERLTQRFLRGGSNAAAATPAFTLRTGETSWWVRSARDSAMEKFSGTSGSTPLHPGSPVASRVVGENVGHPDRDRLRQVIQGVTMLRLDPDALRQPAPLIPEGEAVRLRDERGTGLAAVLDALQTRNLDTISALNTSLRGLFPAFRSLRLRNTSAREKALGVVLTDGTEVPAEEMSEGLLYYLALAVLPHTQATPLILIEEPENGLHPARIREVMSLLRSLSEEVQIVLATHSPLVLNELRGDEISIVTRTPEAGTQAILLSETPDYAIRAKAFENGELWLSYCDGVAEAPLMTGRASA